MTLFTTWAVQAQQSLPYDYGFENSDLEAEGWKTLNPAGGNASKFGIFSEAKHDGNLGFRFSSYDSNSGGYDQYLISPEFDTPDGLLVQFYYKAQSTYGTEKFKIGYSSTDTEIESFVWGDEYSTNNTSWTQTDELSFPAGTKYVAIHYYSNYQYYLFVDDFNFYAPSACPKPAGLTVSGVTHNSATFDWNSDATQWQLLINDSESGYISEKPYTTYMFNPSTSYTVKVRAVCGSDYSDWSNPITFSTSAVAEEVGNDWSDDFEGTSCGWSLVNGTLTNAWAWGTAANNGGTHALYISNDGGETNAYTKNSETMVFATKLLAFEDGEYEFSYDWLCNGEGTVGSSYWDYLRVALVPASVQLVAGTSVPSGFGGAALPSGWFALDGGSALYRVTEWQSKTVSVKNITAGNYYLVLAWRDDTSSGEDHPAAVDNVNIHKVTCSFDANAANLSVSNITTTSATLNWNNVSGVNSWNFAASLESTFPDDDEKTVTGTIPALITSFTIPNALIQGFTLQPGTTYYVKMRAACGTDDFGSWSNVLSFTTECEDITDATWSENFDNMAIASASSPSVQTLPNCWKSINNTTYSTYGVYPTVYYYSYTDHSHSTPNMLRFYSSYSSYSDYDPQDQYAILPAMEDLSNKQIVFWAKASANGTSIQVGTIEDVNDASTFVKMETLELTTGYQEYIVSLAGSSEKHIAIMMEAADENNTIKSVYVDDITVEDLPACSKTFGLAATVIDAHHVQFAWNDNGAGQWKIQYCADPEFENFVVEATADATPFNVDGLDPETTYYARIQSVCASSGVSEWSNAISFTMPIACPVPTFGAEAVSNLGATEATIAWDGNGEDYTLSYRKARYVDGLEETFGTSIPTGWTLYTGLYDEDEGTATLTASTSCWYFGTSNGVFDNHARVNIYGTYQRWLVTPQFVLEGSSLEFDLALTAYSGTLADPETTGNDDKFLVLISEDKENWKVLAQWDNVGTEFSYNDIAHTASGQHVSLDLSDYEGSNIYIAFYGESTVSNADNNLHIDNVLCGTVHEPTAWISESGITEKSKQITGLEPETKYDVKVQSNCGSDGMSQESEIISFTTTPTCVVPANLAVSDITAHTATFSWNGESDYGWQLCINDGGDDEIILATTNPFTVGELKPETEYTAKLRTLCEDDAHSDWSNTVTFTTAVACPAPTNLEVELTPGDGEVARLLWAAGSAEDWILQYSESAAFEPAQEITVNGNSFYDLDDLTPETTYFARVKALCGGEDGESVWSEPISFTPTNAYSMTINEGTAANTVVPVYGSWTDAHSNSQFIIPASTLEEIQYAQLTQLTFYANNTNISWGAAQFEVYVLEVNETTISSLYEWDDLEKVMTAANLSIVNGQMVVTFDAPYQYMGGNLLIGIYQPTSGTYTGCSWYGISATGAALGGYTSNSGSLSISQQNFLPKMTINYIPGEAPTCFKPTNLQVMGIDNHNAYLSWVSDADEWHLCLDGDEENFITRTDPMYAWNGLEANTEHSFKVRSVCGDQVTAWSQEVTFTTLCDPISDLYEFFETYTDWELPACWHGIYESTYPTVAIGYSEYAYSGSNFLYFYSASDASTDQYAILPNIESLDGKRIKFYARKQEATWEDVTMTVGVMTDPSNEATFVALESFTLTSTEYDLYNVSFADYTGEGKFIAIKMDGAETNDAALIIDDIIINDMPSCLEPTGLTFTEITGESATLIWESDAEAWRVYLEGENEEDAEIVYEKSYTFTGLDPMTQHTAVVHAICSEEESSEGSYINFTTDCGAVALPFFDGFENGIDCWTLDANGSSSGLTNTASYEGNMSFAFSYPYYPQYLISPELEVTDNDVNVEFYYAIQSASYPETFQVGYSTSSNNAEDDSWVWSDEIEATNVFSDHWEVYTATLPAGAKYFGIKYNSDDMYYLFIDNIYLEEVEPQDECEAQALPFNEDFEDGIDCWTTVAAAEDTGWAWDDQNNHFFRFYFGDEPQYLISPELVPEDMNARIAFDYKCENAQLSETFKLGYSYDGNSLDEFEWTDELLAEDAENWTQFACVVPGGVTYVAIQYTSIDQYGLQIDNISVTATDKPTSVEALKNDAKAYKFVKDGALFILHNGKLFNAQGKFVK